MIVGVCAIVPFTASAATASYVKVTTAPDDWSGDYLIVFEDEDGNKAFNVSSGSLDSSGNCIDVTISDSKIASDAATNAAKVTIAQIDGGYSIATANGTYIGGASGVNKLASSSEAILNTISLENDSANIVSNTSILLFNPSWNGFRYYKSASQKPVQLYKLTAGSAPTYTVTWKNWDGSVLETDENVAKGATPSYDGEVPTKAEDEQNTYTFSGWSDGKTTYGLSDTLPAVSGDVTYTAQFTANAKPAPEPSTFTVTWKNWDGSDLEVDAEVEKDTLPTYDGEAPAKAEDGENIYTFAAWDDGTTTYILGVDDLPAVTADVTYTAVFTAGKKEIIDGKYYVDGILQNGAGLVKIGNDIYFVKQNGAVYKNASLYVAEAKTNGLMPQGNYFFDEEGKLTIYNGIVNGFYYVDGVLQNGAGLVQIDNDIYFVKQNGAIQKNGSVMIAESKTNGLKTSGLYFFDEDGKMEHINGVYGGFYYENSEIVKGKGIVEFENNLYFVKLNGTIYTGNRLMVPASKTNDLIPAGVYDFASDGKILRDPS